MNKITVPFNPIFKPVHQCKLALMCIDDILNERQFQTVECNDKVKRYYIEVRDRK